MINHYLRRSIRVLIPVALSMLASDAHTQQRSISGAEAAYLQAQQGKPLPQKPGSPPPPSAPGFHPRRVIGCPLVRYRAKTQREQ
jgi:hypothetical protein